jgi:uncharacterized protein
MITQIYNRTISSHIKQWFFKNKILIIYGARQVGKTTLVESMIEEFEGNKKCLYVDCDLISNRIILESQSKEELTKNFGGYDILIIDEAQRVLNIGINLKIMHKYLKDTQIVATGSSSFDLANKVNEPLTGRNLEFSLYPLSIGELINTRGKIEVKNDLKNILKFGLYPDIYNKNEADSIKFLNKISNDYLYRDLLEFSDIRRSDVMYKLLQILATSIGRECSYTELGVKVGLNRITTEKYLDLLEKCFVIKILRPYNNKLEKEISKPFKVYFWDIGIRNSILNNFTNSELSSDIGFVWENFCIIERIKKNKNQDKDCKYYFWRTTDQQEIDLVEVNGNNSLECFEFKWNPKVRAKTKIPEIFKITYPNSKFEIIDNDNWLDFLN